MTFLIITFSIILAFGIGVFYFQALIAFADFFMLCSAEGISSRGAMTMWSVVKRNKEHNPLNEVFEESDFLNRCILDVTRQKSACPEHSKRWDFYVNLLDILYEIRQNLAMKIHSVTAVSSSVDLPEDSVLTLTVSGLGGAQYHSKIVSNNNSGMIINYPSGPKLPISFSWRGKQTLVNLSVGDIVFRFAMTFDPDYWDQSFSTLRLLHSDSFSQEQRRNNIRYNVHIPAIFSVLEPESAAEKVEDDREKLQQELENQSETQFIPVEQRSVVKDLSLSGCRILVGGSVPSSVRCRLLLRLNGERIPVQGVVRISEYIDADDFSYVRIQFTHIERDQLQKICSFIYGIEIAEGDIPPTPQESSDYDNDFANDDSFYNDASSEGNADMDPLQELQSVNDDALDSNESIEEIDETLTEEGANADESDTLPSPILENTEIADENRPLEEAGAGADEANVTPPPPADAQEVMKLLTESDENITDTEELENMLKKLYETHVSQAGKPESSEPDSAVSPASQKINDSVSENRN